MVKTAALITIVCCVSLSSHAQPPNKDAVDSEKKKVTTAWTKTPINRVLQDLMSKTGASIIADGKVVNQTVDVMAVDEELGAVLDQICAGKNWIKFKAEDGTIVIVDDATYKTKYLPKKVIVKIFRPIHIEANDFKTAIQPMLTKGVGTVSVDPRTNKVIVSDLPQVIEQIERLRNQIDIPVVTRVFQIRHADVEAIFNRIKDYKSDAGIIEADPTTHQILVTDIFENVKRMELLIDILDVGLEWRVYDLNNLSEDAVGEIEGVVTDVVSKEAFFKLNGDTGTLLVGDVPPVHEKIEKILYAFDRPIKQVLIEAEVMEVSIDRNFTIGVSYDASRDLFAAVADNLIEFPTDWPTGLAEYTNFRDEFPFIGMGGGGITIDYLSTHIRAQLQAAMSDTDTKVLLQPRLIVKNHETANIFDGRQEPYLSYEPYDYDSSNQYRYGRTSQQSQKIGLEFEITPHISNTGLIEMEIKVENTGLIEKRKVYGGEEFDLVGNTEQSAETMMIIPSGATRVLGGIFRKESIDIRSGIPFLYKIPLIGPILFGSKDKRSTQRALLIFITPYVKEETGIVGRQISYDAVPMESDRTPVFSTRKEEMITTPTLEISDQLTSPSEKTKMEDVIELISTQPAEFPGDLLLPGETTVSEEPIVLPKGEFEETEPEEEKVQRAPKRIPRPIQVKEETEY